MYPSKLLAIAAIPILITSCKHHKPLADCSKAHWEYSGNEGPDHWSEVCYGFTACNQGTHQSPVNITGASTDATLPVLNPNYSNSKTAIVDNGHTLQFNYDAGSKITYKGEDYQLLQYHFHTPSEHIIGGISYPMEVHLVHKNAAGNLLVVGVLFNSGSDNSLLNSFIPNLPPTKDAVYNSNTKYNINSILPPDLGYYTYNGSLTTPPCSETVTWIVLKIPIQASGAQITAFKNIEHTNNRPIMALNSRSIKSTP